MKKTRIIMSLIAGAGVACTVACSSVQKKNTVAMDRDEVRRTIASALDAGIVGPNGEVILFYRNGGNIVVQQCGDYTVLNSRSDCNTKAGTSVANVPVGEFKNRLKAALKLPLGDYSPNMQQKLAIYRKGETSTTHDLLQQQQQLQAAVDQIQDFINVYGAANADTAKLAQLQQQLASVNGQLGDNSQLGVIVQEINGLVDHLVDQIIGQPTLTKFVYSTSKQGFEFNILRTYIRSPGLSATFARIPRGSFQMGSPANESGRDNDEVLHAVAISHDFAMEVTDVTQLQWFLVMGYNPSYFKLQQYCASDYLQINGTDLCPNNPVEQVSWDDTQAFIQKLNQNNDGNTYRLPTEAEWEYAARAGSQTAYYFGDDASGLDANSWYFSTSGSQTHEVGGKAANAFGLYDMAGNVWEWAQDWYGTYPAARVVDPMGASTGSDRVIRGGGWYNGARSLRSALRSSTEPSVGNSGLGFRLVRTATP